jgi:hypothetical protein
LKNIERARLIRDAILAQEENVERGSVLIDGVEHAAWVVHGSGWHAVVSNLWDLHLAACFASYAKPNDRENVIGYELVQVFHEGVEVMAFCYEIGGDDEHLFIFTKGGWVGLFGSEENALLKAA